MNLAPMFITIIMVLALGAALVTFIIRKRSSHSEGNLEQLKERYKLRLNMPDAMAEDVIQSQRAKLKRRFPGRSERWYLEKMLYDLERDRG